MDRRSILFSTGTSDEYRATEDRPWRLQAWLGIETSTKPKVYSQVFEASKFRSLGYWLGIFFSAGIATFGLVENSPAVIIGAMLISPLMGPIMATGLALAIGDVYLGIKAVLNLVVSIAASIAFSGFLVWLLPFHSVTSEILARTNPNLLDLGIALLSGLAGSVVVSRGSSDGITALPGVAIAVALMPPLCAMGFGLGSGADLEIMGGAGLLFLTNLVAIVASAFLVFFLVGLNTPIVHQMMFRSRAEESLARALEHTPVERILSKGGRLHWRILMVLILLIAIALPLRKALLQVTHETLTREAVQSELKLLAPPDTLISQQVTVSNDAILIRLISTRPIPASKIDEARNDLIRRTGQDVQLSVEAVASRRELADLMERLTRPAAPPPPKQQTVDEIQRQLLDKIRPAVQDIWPSDAPIQNISVILGAPEGLSIEVQYQAARDLGDIPVKIVQHSLQTKLGIPNLTVKAERLVAPEKDRRKNATAPKRTRP